MRVGRRSTDCRGQRGRWAVSTIDAAPATGAGDVTAVGLAASAFAVPGLATIDRRPLDGEITGLCVSLVERTAPKIAADRL